MSRIILVTGGARSGKSSFAESIFDGIKEVTYIATSKIYDEEMRQRIELHRKSRPNEWTTYEDTYDIYKAVGDIRSYIVDCITVMTSNIMFDITKDYKVIPFEKQEEVENKVLSEIEALMDKVKAINGELVMVTNEVGYSIVPDNHISRVYRDIIGRINQRVAKLCTEVYFVTCGIPRRIK
ncbi:bifunctional adenosylcobinamide kinase/adenosylcobinamide-phosphate guanylyltransferase [Clostridium arbusti]|uniref:bifunctional adenosylcobinamide kinase/adenosylcobinamide-phosphate guanylyltransferase n=1 Tax=Clostridium arbusti TaxID=1137848 RepID=UPI0002899308|nr:bifunctional adenosylcobinamide kinase/adenosylcobinamide-phosphate guanylyltransferase [Clostridium arbusti]